MVSRSVKAHEYAEKRNAILDVAMRYIATKGYEQMTTQDILEALQISRGAFYHYFESKQALLMGLVERIGEQAEQLVLPVVSDRQMPAQDKLLRFFAVLDQHKRENLDLVFAFLRVWYADENALFRHKLYLARIKWLSPWLSQIIREGVAEGVFTTPYPDQAARIIISLLEDLGYATAEVLFVEEGEVLAFPRIAQIGEATADALERVLGMQPGCLRQSWSEDLSRRTSLIDGLMLCAPQVKADPTQAHLPKRTTLVQDPALVAELGPVADLIVVQSPRVVEAVRQVLAEIQLADPSHQVRLEAAGPSSFEVAPLVPFGGPTLIITARQDPIVGYRDAWDLLDSYPSATFAVLDRAGHFVNIEQNGLCHALMREWLDRVEECESV